MRRLRRQTVEYVGVLTGALVIALVSSWTSLGGQIDKDAYDIIFRIYRPPERDQQSIVLGIDEESFHTFGGVRGLRKAVADGLERVAAAAPKAVAIDVTLADDGDPGDDARLEQAIRKTPNAVLACYLRGQGSAWEDPLPRFSRGAAGKGHGYAEADPVCPEV